MIPRPAALVVAGIVFVAVAAGKGGEAKKTPGPVRMTTLDGHPLVMSNFAERRGTVVVFLSGRCEATEKKLDAIKRLHAKYRLRGVLFVGLCSNARESSQELRTFCQRRGVIFPVYRDADGATAKQFGAKVTPEAFLLDKMGTVVYRGAIDGLAEAISQLLSDQPIDQPVIPATGTSIDRPGPKRGFSDPHGWFAFSSELVFEKIPQAAAHHCSTIAEAPNGDLLCLWYGGSYESADDQVLFLSRRQKGRRTWNKPRVVVRNPGQPPGNAVVFVDDLKRVWIIWARMEASRPIRRGGGWGDCRLIFRTSTDNGLTWGEDKILDNTVGWLVRNVPIRLKSSELLLPVSGKVDGAYGSFFLKTADNGKSWQRTALIPGGSQPTVVERDDGSWLTLMRKSPRILESISKDGGKTWTPPRQTKLRNPGAGIAMTRLHNGHMVLVFNDSQISRSPLSITRSLDGGQTWQRPLKLEANPGEYSYPCVIQTSDGKIHITYTYRRYTIKHVEFDEPWLIHLDRPN